MRPTPSLGIKFRKLALTTKDVNKGFYKGNRTGSMGRHTKHGGYIIEWEKVRTYAVPPLEDFQVCLSPVSVPGDLKEVGPANAPCSSRPS